MNSLISISRLTVVELTSGLAIVRTQVIGRADVDLFWRQFREDIVSESSTCSPSETHSSSWQKHSFRDTFRQSASELDALQIAVAIGRRDQNLIDCFVSADKILCKVGAVEGFLVLNPEDS